MCVCVFVCVCVCVCVLTIYNYAAAVAAAYFDFFLLFGIYFLAPYPLAQSLKAIIAYNGDSKY